MKRIKNVFQISDDNWIFSLCLTLGLAAGFVSALLVFNSERKADVVSHVISSVFAGVIAGFIAFSILLFLAAAISEVVNWFLKRRKKK